MTRFRFIDDEEILRRPVATKPRRRRARLVPPPPPSQAFLFGDLPLPGRHRHRCSCRREFVCTMESCRGKAVLCVPCLLDRHEARR